MYRNAAIHAEAPEFVDMSVEQEILVTGIKVVDLLAPYAKGGKIGWCIILPPFIFDTFSYMLIMLIGYCLMMCSFRSVWRGWCGQDCIDYGADQQRGQSSRWLLCVCRSGRANP